MIVAGAAPGKGGATAIRLAQEGTKVIAADLNQEAAPAVVDEIKSARAYAVARDSTSLKKLHALPLLFKRGNGAIVNTSSSSVWIGEAERVAYHNAKSGLVGLTRPGQTRGQR